MLPVLAIVGRPNVGKSTLFNRLTRSRAALVADEPGLTRDRQLGVARVGGRRIAVVDTGGLGEESTEIDHLVSEQALRAVRECDVVVLVTDARAGLTPGDERVAETIRREGRPTLVAVNKSEGMDAASAAADFYRLGLRGPLAVSAAHGQGIHELEAAVAELLPGEADDAVAEEDGATTRVAIVGRPNAGKSTLVNRLVGETRVIAHDAPGTTRDSVRVPFSRGGRAYELVDTAGIRRRARVADRLEKFSVIQSLRAIEECDVAILVLDATRGLAEQDLGLLGHVLDAGRALVIAVNKWDAADGNARDRFRRELDRRLTFVDYASVHFVSALRGTGLTALLRSVWRAREAAHARLPTPELTRVLAEAVARNPPPVVHGRRIKLRYAHQGGSAPPTIVVHGNQTESVPAPYRRFLARAFREAFSLHGTPLVVELRTGDNPYKGRRNPLTPRQIRRRKRLVRHARRRR